MTASEGTATRGWVDRLLTVNGWLVFLFLYAPIAVLVLFSFSGDRNVGTWGGFSLRWYDAMFANDPLLNSLRNSVVVALVATVVSTVLGTAAGHRPGALPALGVPGRRSTPCMYLPMIIPDVTMAVMLLMWFTTIGWSLSLNTIILAHIAFCISFVAIVVRARLANMDPALDEAAADLYASRWQAFRRVTLPVIMPGVLGGALLALTISLDDVVVTSLVQGPGATTLPVYVFGLIKRDVTPQINAVSTVMLVASMVLVMVSLVFQRRGEAT